MSEKDLLVGHNPYSQSLSLYEKKAMLADTIHNLTAGKGKKYVSLKTLQSHLDIDDSALKEIVDSAAKANRFSNKYIFTTVDGEPSIGVTAAKRKPTEKEQVDVEIGGELEDRHAKPITEATEVFRHKQAVRLGLRVDAKGEWEDKRGRKWIWEAAKMYFREDR